MPIVGKRAIRAFGFAGVSPPIATLALKPTAGQLSDQLLYKLAPMLGANICAIPSSSRPDRALTEEKAMYSKERKNRTQLMIGRSLTMAAALAFATPGIAQPAAVAEALSPAEAELATDEELQQARGGWVWVVVIAGARASQIAIRMCASRTDSCARGAAAVFTSASAARRWVCNRYGRFC